MRKSSSKLSRMMIAALLLAAASAAPAAPEQGKGRASSNPRGAQASCMREKEPHIDHTGELPGLVKARDLGMKGAVAYRIFGPEGGGPYPSTTRFIDRLFGEAGAFAYLPGFKNPLTFAVTDLPVAAAAPPRIVLEEDGLRVTSIAVDHGDTPAVAYRIEWSGSSLVISGDLASKNDNLARLAASADVLVYDTTVLDPPGSPKPLYALHTAPRRIGEVAAAAGVKSLVLSHYGGDVDRARSEVVRSVNAAYHGPVRFAADCLRIELSAGKPGPKPHG